MSSTVCFSVGSGLQSDNSMRTSTLLCACACSCVCVCQLATIRQCYVGINECMSVRWSSEPVITVTDRNVPTWLRSHCVSPVSNQTASNAARGTLMGNRLVCELPRLLNRQLWLEPSSCLEITEMDRGYAAAGDTEQCDYTAARRGQCAHKWPLGSDHICWPFTAKHPSVGGHRHPVHRARTGT